MCGTSVCVRAVAWAFLWCPFSLSIFYTLFVYIMYPLWSITLAFYTWYILAHHKSQHNLYMEGRGQELHIRFKSLFNRLPIFWKKNEQVLCLSTVLSWRIRTFLIWSCFDIQTRHFVVSYRSLGYEISLRFLSLEQISC